MDFENDFEDSYFVTKYGKMHYKHHKGNDKPIIFLHGFAASVKSWTRLVAYLPVSLDIYLIDLLGHGTSEAPEIDYSLLMHYGTIVDFIKKNIDMEPFLFGHSYGGWIASYYAINRKIPGLMLEDSAGMEEFVEERHRINPSYRETMLKDALQLNPSEHVLRSMLHSDNSKQQLDSNTLSKVDCRCLIVWGKGDKIIDVKYSKMFNDRIRGSTLRVIDDAKHTPHYSNPELIANLVNDFTTETE